MRDNAALKKLMLADLMMGAGMGIWAFLPARLIPITAFAAVLAAGAAWGLARRNFWLAAATAFFGVVLVVRIANVWIADLLVQVHVLD